MIGILSPVVPSISGLKYKAAMKIHHLARESPGMVANGD
jgi:hypothetical protein